MKLRERHFAGRDAEGVAENIPGECRWVVDVG